MKWSFPLLLLLSSLASSGQKTPAPAGFTGGVEADVLPFLTGGYYMSVWGGYKHVRYRIVLTEVNTPQFLLPEKFSNNEIEAYALIADYFFHRDFRGCWIGTGLEWWKGQIDARNASATGHPELYASPLHTGNISQNRMASMTAFRHAGMTNIASFIDLRHG